MIDKLENLKRRYEELVEEYEALGKELKRLTNQTVERWEPAINKNYWCLNSIGEVFSERNTDHEFDKDRILLGNCFRTKKEALRYVERVRMFNLLYQYADVKKPKQNEIVIFPRVDREDGSCNYTSWKNNNVLPFGFSSEEKLNAAIDAIGRDEFIRIWGGLEDEAQS